MEKVNLFEEVPQALSAERFEVIAKTAHVRIERIISCGHSSPPGFWYDQDQSEWLVLLQGRACLSFLSTEEKTILNPGDHLIIPAHVKHRVDWTDPRQPTVWLAVHYS
jgi:cupin 2 domain-containing protein